MKQSSKEKKNKQMGAIVSVGSHILAILLFLFMIAWRAPDPPMPKIGIELNFGLDDAGTGEVQPEPNTQPAESESEEESAPDGLEETPEEVVEEVTESVDEPTESDETPTEEVTPVDNTQDSPDVVEEKPEPIVKKEVKEEAKKVEKAKMTYPSNEGQKKEDITNQGNDKNEVGDKGNEDGALDSPNYGDVAGGGGGGEPILKMGDWKWNSPPNPKELSSERGTIVLEVTIDDKGEVLKVTTKESSVNRLITKKYEDEVWKLSFYNKAGISVTGTSTGTIIFIVKDK